MSVYAHSLHDVQQLPAAVVQQTVHKVHADLPLKTGLSTVILVIELWGSQRVCRW